MGIIKLQTEIARTPRVMQLEGMFDLQAAEYSVTEIQNTIPDLSTRDWNVGLIVGPSGAGKTTVAREMFGDQLLQTEKMVWDNKSAVIDNFPKELAIREITEMLSSVGFSSPPAWLRPFEHLSNGEKFRVTMARVLAESKNIAVVDEFTSVIDRTVAQIGSAAIAKTVRARKQKFVAVACHYDIEEWLQPDWIYQPHIGAFTWGSVQPRPQVKLEIIWAKYEAWHLFARHHYLTADLNKSAQIYVGLINDQPAVLTAILPLINANVKNARRISRTVVLPDYQGIGIGGKFVNAVCAGLKAQGLSTYTTTSHPARVRALNKSKEWEMIREPSRVAQRGKTSSITGRLGLSRSRITTGFRYAGEPNEDIAKVLCPRPVN
jgi:ABC-type Mn2+/Zn2+ transport system ATPase subunit/GNAT superfamily N-acetyltransferase